MLTVFAALERWRPVEPVTDRAAVRVDIVYTLIHRLGSSAWLLFFTRRPAVGHAVRRSCAAGRAATSTSSTRSVAGVTDIALVSFLLYLVLFDFVDYCAAPRPAPLGLVVAAARGAPQPAPDDDVERQPQPPARRPDPRQRVRAAWRWLVGVAPGQFVALVALTQLVESLSHANVRLSFGPWLGAPAGQPAVSTGCTTHRPGA
jgi:sterol desaturase/sphingolipid hydroxylase (fatty acid hydroxylase superfamily)